VWFKVRFGLLYYGRYALAVAFVAVVGLYVGDDMVAGIYYRLRAVVKLPRLARLYTYSCIGVGGAVVGVVAQKLGANEMAVFIYLFAVGIGWLVFILFGFPGMMLFYFLFAQIAYGVFF
jgi:hypothetical protein